MTQKILFVCIIMMLAVAVLLGLVTISSLSKELDGYRKAEYAAGGVYYDFNEPNILRHVQGNEVTVYRKVEVPK